MNHAGGARRIGILGGTFDPVHIGHLRGALEVAEMFGLDELRLIPNARPPHRDTPNCSAQDRLAMVRLAVQDLPPLCVDARELERDKPSYTIDTLMSLRAELAADDQLLLVVGWDAFCGLPTWHRWEELLDYCHILVLQRPDAGSEAPQELRDLLAARSVPTRRRSAAAADRSPSSGRHPWKCPPRRFANCWPAASRSDSWFPMPYWLISTRTDCTGRRTEVVFTLCKLKLWSSWRSPPWKI